MQTVITNSKNKESVKHKKILYAAVAALALAFSNVQAALYDRGNGMIYDDVLDITWLSDIKYAATQYAASNGTDGDADGTMNWAAANVWANNLSYGGNDDWRCHPR